MRQTASVVDSWAGKLLSYDNNLLASTYERVGIVRQPSPFLDTYLLDWMSNARKELVMINSWLEKLRPARVKDHSYLISLVSRSAVSLLITRQRSGAQGKRLYFRNILGQAQVSNKLNSPQFPGTHKKNRSKTSRPVVAIIRITSLLAMKKIVGSLCVLWQIRRIWHTSCGCL